MYGGNGTWPCASKKASASPGRLDLPQIAGLTLHAFHDAHLAAGGSDDQPGPDGLAGAHLHPGTIRAQRALQEDLDAPAGWLGAEQPRGHHARVVEDQQVVRVAAAAADRRSGDRRARRWRHPASAAGWPIARQRRLGDQFRWQFVVEIGAAHRGAHGIPCAPASAWPSAARSSSGPPLGMVTSRFCALRSRCTRSVSFSPSR